MVTHPTMESWPRRRYRYLRKAEARPAWRSIPSGPLLPCAAWQGAWRRDLSSAASTSTAHRTAFGKPRSRRNFAYTREHREMGNRPTPSAGAADTLENARSRVSASRFLRSRGARARIAPHRHLSGSSGFRVGKGVLGLHQAPPQASMVPLCAISNCTKSSWDLRRRGESRQWRYKKPQGIRRLSEITVRVGWPPDVPLHCPECEAVVPGYDTRPRRWRHLNDAMEDLHRGRCPAGQLSEVRGPTDPGRLGRGREPFHRTL